MLLTESIDFSVEQPTSGPYVKLKQTQGCDYRSDMSAWEIRDSQGYFEFTINVDDILNIGLIEFVLRSCNGLVEGSTNCPITIRVNGQIIEGCNGKVQNWRNETAYDWYDEPFYIPLGLIKAGENTIRVQAQGGSTVFFLQKITLSRLMHGSESIDFSVEKPTSGSCFKLNQASGCDYRSDMSAWEIKNSQGFFEFTFSYPTDPKASGSHGVGIALRSCSGLVNGATDCPVTISVNESKLVEKYDPHQVQWYEKLFYIPPTQIVKGENTIRVQADGGATVFFLQKITLSAFHGQLQKQTNWCWATCTVNIATYYNPSITWTQGSLVNAEFKDNDNYKKEFGNAFTGDCTVDGSTTDCNRGWYVVRSLSRTGNLDKWEAQQLTIDQIEDQIAKMQPIVARIGWTNGGGHFVAIVGVGKTDEVLAIEDPWYGPSLLNYNSFCTNYQGSGKWTHHYFTKK